MKSIQQKIKSWYYNIPINTKLNITNIVIIIIPMVLLAVLSNKISSDIIFEKSVDSSMQELDITRRSLDNLFNQVDYLSKSTATNAGVQNVITLQPDQLPLFLEKRINVIGSLEDIVGDKNVISANSIMTVDGFVVTSGDIDPSKFSRIEPEGARIELPGVPNPLQLYPQVLRKKMKNSRASYIHGDLHLRNVLLDDFGFGRLIDFAKVEERHNLFDLVKLETYVRLMGLADVEPTFSLDDYVQFEEALVAEACGKSATPPRNPHLLFAQNVILDIRRIARNYMAQESQLLDEYLPALFLYCLAVMKYYQADHPQPTRLAFMTAGVLGKYL